MEKRSCCMPSREPEVGSLENFPMERPPEPPAAFVSCQRSAFSGRLTPNAGHLPLNESAPWAAGTGSPAGIPYGVGVYGSPATAGTELTEKTVLGTFSPMSDKDAVGASRSVKHNIVYILCKHILYVLCKHIVYKFSLIPGQFYLLGVDHCELKRPFSSGTPVYPH